MRKLVPVGVFIVCLVLFVVYGPMLQEQRDKTYGKPTPCSTGAAR